MMPFGYQPKKPSQKRHLVTNADVLLQWMQAFGVPNIPPWWPTECGHPILHIYRKIEKEYLALSSNMTSGVPNFADAKVKRRLLAQLAAASESHPAPRSECHLLSAHTTLEDCVQLAASHGVLAIEPGYKPSTPKYARFDLFAMFQAGRFTPDSFIDLSTSTKWATSFPPDEWYVCPTTKRVTIQYHTFYIGDCQRSWIDYCHNVDPGNRKRTCQSMIVPGEQIQFGKRLDALMSEDVAMSRPFTRKNFRSKRQPLNEEVTGPSSLRLVHRLRPSATMQSYGWHVDGLCQGSKGTSAVLRL